MRSILIIALAMLVAAPCWAQNKKKNKKNQDAAGARELAPESPEALALDELLEADARYASDGTVELRYGFKRPEELQDFEYQGFDEVGRAKKGKKAKNKGLKGKTLHLIAGSQRTGLCLHRLTMKGNYELTITATVNRMSTRGTLVFMFGKAGLRWGSQLVYRTGSGWKTVLGEPSRKAFENHTSQTFTIKVANGEVSVMHQGKAVVSTEKLEGKTDGVIGFYLQDVNMIVHSVELKGDIDKTKL